MLQIFKDIGSGILIGIANIIPGVSGATIAVTFGFYDRIIDAINGIFKSFKKSVLVLLPIVIGMAVAIVLGAIGITKLRTAYPLPLALFFVGLLIGGLPQMEDNRRQVFKSGPASIIMVAMMILVVGLALIGGPLSGDSLTLPTTGIPGIICLCAAGALASATMVMPGVSGSMLLMLLGYYNPITEAISSFVSGPDRVAAFLILLPAGIGIIIGILGMARFVKWLFVRFPKQANGAMYGLVASSAFAVVLLNIDAFKTGNVRIWVIAGACALGGFALTFLLGKRGHSK